ncbi:MAG: hypothetical protein FWD13_07155 [Treponema sp.]|nr:hypothetical protein [Treponema sp.]
MKKYGWILALFTALALLFVGCPGEGDDDEEEDELDPLELQGVLEAFSATTQKQDKANVYGSDGYVIFEFTGSELWGELIAPSNEPFDATGKTGVKFEYKSTANATIFAQDTNTIHIYAFNNSDGWGAIPAANDWTEFELEFSVFQLPENNGTSAWFGEDEPLDISEIIKFAFQIASGSNPKKFEIRNFELIE